MDIIFQNLCGNGDLHLSRNFVKDIILKLSDNNFYYCHRQNKNIFNDIPKLDQKYSLDKLLNKLGKQYFNVTTRKIDNEFFINTWIGQCGMIYHNEKKCSIYSYYNLFKVIYDELNIPIENIEYYIPTIDYDYFYLDDIKNYIDDSINKKILVCNGPFMSGQYSGFDFNPIIDNLSEKHKDIDFILTDDENKIKKNNIFYTKDIINKEDSDLNEISYLSTKCDIIIGRASGPYILSLVKDNLFNEKIKFIGFSIHYYDAVVYDTNTKCEWVCFTNPNENILKAIDDNI